MKEKKEKKRREVLAGGERGRQTERDHLSSIVSAKVLKSLRLPGLLSGILTGICHCKSTDKSTADEFAVSLPYATLQSKLMQQDGSCGRSSALLATQGFLC